ncbi:MAG: phage tail length tape measure family protein [Methylobacteriaceae bacterium]
MTVNSIAIRLGVEGGAELRRTLDEAGTAGQTAFQRIGAAADQAGAATDRQTARFQRLAAAQREAEARERAQANVNALLGVRDAPVGAAKASASVFEEAARVETEALRRAAEARTATVRTTVAGWRELGTAGAATLANIDAGRRLGAMGSVPAAANQNAAPGKAAGRRLRPDEVTNLMYQGGDVAAQLASGSSLGLIALQQGPQIAQMFAGPGGASVKGALGQASEAAAGLAARIGLVGAGIGGLTAAAALGVTALIAYRNGQAEVEKALTGVGRASGATLAGINAVADGQSQAGAMSRRSAREIAATYAGTGRIDASLLGGAVGATPDLARFLGVERAEGATELAAALADVSRGATDLAQRYGLLSDAQAESIRRLEAQGDRLGAQRRLLDTVRDSTRGLAEATTGWGRATEWLSDRWDALGRGLDRIVTGGDLDTRLKTARDALAEARKEAEGANGYYRQAILDPRIATYEREVAELEKQVGARDAVSEQAQRAQRSTEVGGVIRSLLPEQRELQALQDKVELVRKATADPVKFGLDARQLQEATAAFERIARLARTMADDVDRFGSTAVAAANRAAEFGLRTATMNPVDRAAAEIRETYARKAREAGLDPEGRSSEQVRSAYEARLQATTDLFERQRLARERDKLLLDGRKLDGLRRERDLGLEALRARTEQSAIRSTRIPESFVPMIVGAESGGRDTARNPRSSATGAGQFIDGTWLRLFKDRFAERAAAMSDGEILARRTHRADSEAMIEAYAQENARALERARLPVTSTNLYLGHHFGEGGMLALLRADPDARARDVLGRKVAEANPRTVGDQTVGGTIGTVAGMVARNDPGIRASRDQVEVMRAQIGVTDMAAASAARLERVQELLNQERQRGSDLGRAFVTAQDLIAASSEKLTPEMAAQRKAILEIADAYGQVSAASTDYRGRSTLMFEREQLGRTDAEASIYARARSVYGETGSREAQAFIGQARENAELYEAKSMITDGARSFVSDLRRSGDAASALSNAFGSAADRLMSKALDSVISSAFGGGGSGSGGAGGIGGFLASLFGGGGGDGKATGMTLYASPAGPGFADGGWTGPGGRTDVAGLVHRGEVVFSQDDVARHGGVTAVEALRRSGGLRGYAAGGVVGREVFTMPSARTISSAGADRPAIVFSPNIVPPTGYEARTREVDDGQGGRRPEIFFEEMTARGIQSPRGQAALKQQRLAAR